MRAFCPRWSPRAALAFGLTLSFVACSSENDATTDVDRVDTTTAATATTSTIPPSPTEASAPPTVRSSPPTVATGLPTGPVGIVDIAEISRLPRSEYTWTITELDRPDSATYDVTLLYIGAVDGRYVAVASGSASGDTATLTTWHSNDGLTWARAEQTLPQHHAIEQVIAGGPGLLAIGYATGGDAHEFTIWQTDTHLPWQQVDLRADGVDPYGLMSTQQAAVGNGIVIAVQLYHPDPNTSTVFETDEFRISIDDPNGVYNLTERESDTVVASGPTTDIYPWREGGQAVWNLDTRELLVVIPWDVWDSASSTGSPLPVPTPTSPQMGSGMTVEADGFRVFLDHDAERFEVTLIESGELVTSGTVHAFYLGPAPRFVDNTTGEIVLSLTWDEWDQLMQFGTVVDDEPPSATPPRLVTLASPDGFEWSATDLGSSLDQYIASLHAVGDGFELNVFSYSNETQRTVRYTSADGIDWESTTHTQTASPIGDVVSGPAGLLALGWDRGGRTLSISADGNAWTPAFYLPPQADGRDAQLVHVASGASSRAVLGTLTDLLGPEPLAIAVGALTVRFPDMDGVEIVDTETDEVILRATSRDLELALQGEQTPIASYDDGVTTFWLDGQPLVAIDDAMVESARAAEHQRYLERIEQFAFVEVDGDWYEVAVPALGSAMPHLFDVGDDDELMIGVLDFGDMPSGPTIPSLSVLIGRPER